MKQPELSEEQKKFFERDARVMTKIISIAMKNGWVPIGAVGNNFKWTYQIGTFHMKTPIWDGDKMVDEIHSASIEKVIFDHDFAKALWGEEIHYDIDSDPLYQYGEPAYKFNLKNLAVAENRAEFLEQFAQ